MHNFHKHLYDNLCSFPVKHLEFRNPVVYLEKGRRLKLDTVSTDKKCEI